MYKQLTSTWTIFFALTFGVFLLMVGVRPELQPRPGHERAAGPTVEVVGHTLTWSTSTILVYRMVQSVREQARINREQSEGKREESHGGRDSRDA